VSHLAPCMVWVFGQDSSCTGRRCARARHLADLQRTGDVLPCSRPTTPSRPALKSSQRPSGGARSSRSRMPMRSSTWGTSTPSASGGKHGRCAPAAFSPRQPHWPTEAAVIGTAVYTRQMSQRQYHGTRINAHYADRAVLFSATHGALWAIGLVLYQIPCHPRSSAKWIDPVPLTNKHAIVDFSWR
jgi:hypothetical protein